MKKIEAEQQAEFLNKWVWPGTYYLHHGEQGRPIFTAAGNERFIMEEEKRAKGEG